MLASDKFGKQSSISATLNLDSNGDAAEHETPTL